MLSGAAQAPAAKSFIGTVAAFKPDTQVEIKPDNAPPMEVKLTADTIAQRVAPGEKNLKNAVTVNVTELSVGDRVLVTLESAYRQCPAHHHYVRRGYQQTRRS